MTTEKKTLFECDKKVPEKQPNDDALSILQKHPDKIPIIIKQGETSKIKLPEKFKFKFLVANDDTVGSFIYELRKRINLKPEESLFIFVDNVVPPTSATLGEIYSKYKDKDGFLKMIFTEENTFGEQ